jgi:hypothetical protein
LLTYERSKDDRIVRLNVLAHVNNIVEASMPFKFSSAKTDFDKRPRRLAGAWGVSADAIFALESKINECL